MTEAVAGPGPSPAAPAIDWTKVVSTSPPTWVFKQDRRSRVWQIETPEGPMIVKRFEHFTLRQLAASLVGKHPAQRELKMAKELRDKGVAVVPIVGHGKQWAGLGCKLFLVTPYVGKSVHQLGREGELESPVRRKHVVDQIAAVTAKLVEREVYFRDLKASNILMDNKARLWLIDVGSARKAGKRVHMLKMLGMLLKTLAMEEIPPAERYYLLQRIVALCPFLGDPQKLAQDIDKTKLP